ncbi:MAG: DUF2796 domain-containing protein [Rhodospirillales bacterium]|nr:DUF2796 domain-containing protein [Rhodospirillales bacterium]MBO6786074.1 DUF2796 domain-containing protein [Rhodospirillales bacterium]
MNSKSKFFTGLVAAAAIGIAGAASASGEPNAPGAHVHGAGALNVVVEGNDVIMELTLPGADVVGFEHKAESDKDAQAVHEALEKLENAANVFVLPAAAGCAVVEAHAESSLVEETEAHGHANENRHEAEHEAGHGDFGAIYEFTCATPDALKDIEVKLFVLFPSLEEVDVQAVTAKGQWAKELTPSDNRFLLAF